MLKIKLLNHQTGEAETAVLTPETMTQNECLIGRAASCNLILNSFDVSRIHGRIQLKAGEYHYADLGSANGSTINNKPVEINQNYSLNAGDLIQISDFVLLVDAIEPPQFQEAAPMRDELEVRCVRTIEETSDVKTFAFVADPPVQFNYQPGQFVTLELTIQGEEVLRSYSISSTPTRPATLEITVKRVPAPTPAAPPGLVSNWLHDHLKVGDRLKLSGILGKFTCFPKPAPKLLLISAGSGITPMMSMSRWLMDTVSSADVMFFHCARTPSDIIFRQELELMTTRFANFHLACSVTQSSLGQPWSGLRGRLTEAMLHAIAPDLHDRTVYVCGPESFMQGVKAMFSALDFPMQNYFEESFGAPKPKSKESPAKAVEVVPSSVPAGTQPIACFSQSGKEVASDGTESILELAEQAGVKIRSSCRQGVCGACKKRKLSGTVRYETEPNGLDRSDQEAGFILACVATPIDRVVVEA